MGKWNWKERRDAQAQKGTSYGNYLECSNPKCTCLYPAARHKEGTAIMRGKAHYCKLECAQEHKEMLKRNEREQK